MLAPQEPKDARWWVKRKDDTEPHEPHELIRVILDTLRPEINRRRETAKRNAKAYGVDLSLLGLVDPIPNEGQLVFNQAANVIDTIVSKTTKNRVVPMAMTTGATRAQRVRAKEFNRYIAGLFEDSGVYEKDAQWVCDALLFEEGICKVVPDYENKRICFERCFPWEVNVDLFEARYGKPQSLYHTYFVERMVLKAMYGGTRKNDKIIDSITQTSADDEFYAMPRASDMVMVTEAWHLPSSPTAGDGAYAVVVRDGTLLFEEYKRDHFPFAHMYRKPPVVGIHGQPLMSDLRAAQEELDLLMDNMREGAETSVTRMLVPRSCNIQKSAIDDVPGAVLEYDGPDTPKEMPGTPFSRDLLEYWELLQDKMVEKAGVNQMSAEGQMPAGITAARAIQMVEDTESERLGPFWRSREAFYVTMCQLGLEAARDLAKENAGFVVRGRSESRYLKPLKIDDIDIAVDDYRLQVFPTSLLSRTPAAKYDQLSEMRARGDIDPREFRRLLDMPDLDSENDLETSSIDIVDKCIDAILEKGIGMMAEPFDDHALIVQRGTKAYNLARCQMPDDAAEKKEYLGKLKALRVYILSAMKFLQPPPSTQAPAGMAGMPAPPPVAPPGPPPPLPPPIAPGAIQPMAPPGAEIPIPPPT